MTLALAVAFCAYTAYLVRSAADASHTINDGATYRFQANMLSVGAAWMEEPEEADAFRFPMVLRHEGKWFGQYYPGFPLLLAAGVRAGADWLVNPLLGGLVVLGTFLLGRRLFDAITGLVAAGIVAVSPIHLSLSTKYLSHVACSALLLFSALAMLRGARKTEWPWGAVAGLLFGWAVATRPFTGLLAAPALGLILFARLRSSPRHGARLTVAFAAPAILCGIGLLAWNDMLTGHPLRSAFFMRWPHLGLGFHEIAPHKYFMTGRIIEYYGPSIAAIATGRQLANLNEWLLPYAGAAAFASLLSLVFFRSLGWRGAALALFPVSLVAGHFFFPGTLGVSARGTGPRYYSEALPALSILLARPITHVVSLGRVGRILGVIVVGALALGALRSVPEVAIKIRRSHASAMAPNRRLERFLAARPGERRVVFVDVSTYNHASTVLVNRSDLEGRDLVAIYRRPALNRAVLDAYPGRSAYLVRWNDANGAFTMTPYVPEEDEDGPPNRFPYNLRKWNRARRSGSITETP
jgi:4-amino-4-deoxy-L-arabinose transferase-like glycosyltransferase